ncbi:ribulokinase [Devosia epidermidihirudinis]|uniref:Ribulokinase n=1 Tax=Devosia epidermidihirudinis TaxID=1293439 RepID=A0A0F5Q8Z1_9HYPH|nr:FGGY-family carbohydrate kinase [Devosia epidermidihirudinis]KKC37400.1 ribulokinase [Devosia epidermidihirudinis]
MAHFIGIDVGTGSARAGLFDSEGMLLATASRPIQIWRPRALHAEQSSRDIWQAVCASVRAVLNDSGITPDTVAGIGFDATCSLVVVDGAGGPVAVNADGEDDRNIILWMDQRATLEAEEINQSGARVLDYVGGRISPEMETPKILWLARHLPDGLARAAHLMDLADFLTWKATGSLVRSTCTVTCKWTYLAHESAWDESYFDRIGLSAFKADGFARIGNQIVDPGTSLASGLTAQAATELGLSPDTPVAAGIIDAHAGAIGTLGAAGLPGAVEQRLAYVFGTSACTLNVTREPVHVPGIWGPYYSALMPGMWLNEGGQSAAGAAIDHLVLLHPYAPEALRQAELAGVGLTQWLDQRAQVLLAGGAPTDLIEGLHVVPEFLGNRAPFADPQARGIIAGLSLEADEASLVRLYLVGLASIGYGLRQILDTLRAKNIDISTVVVSGGAARSRLVRRMLADAAGIAIATVRTDEPVLLGSAMLAKVASGQAPNVESVMADMSRVDDVINPDDASRSIHQRRHQTFLKLQAVYRDMRDH